ncbi:MAG TPA: class I SAM-dependent methyltransferase [Nitriliruptorales bacterium]|nr:class I SAM-dependent methyltransferase [Nitriliruptorales bacterium]
MERRASLPGADELFRTTARQPSRELTPDPDPRGGAPDVDQLALAQLVEMAAAEDAAMSAVRGRAGYDAGLPSPAVGTLLAWVAGLLDARAVVELGSAAGYTALWLLRGMSPRGVLTSIEPDAPAQGLAVRAFSEAGVNHRVRAIAGDPLEVLPRLSDHGYDLLLVQRIGADHARVKEHAKRLLRPGGVLVALDVAAGLGAELRGRRNFVQALIDDDAAEVGVLPLDGGVVLARFGASTP